MESMTETSNVITSDIDTASPSEIVRQLQEADAQLFTERQGMRCSETVDVLKNIISIAAKFLENDSDDQLIVLSGCGTSGRLAFLTARNCNQLLEKKKKRPIFEYLIAGNDEALFVSQELTEDNPHTGKLDLEKVSKGKKQILYAGITCGFSAAYIAGQLDYCLDNPDIFIPVLLGFNPVELAKDNPVEGWDKTFLQVAKRLSSLQKSGNGFVINPLLGAEPITGSTRMKGGSATKILLETIFLTSMLQMELNERVIDNLLSSYETVQKAAYDNHTNLTKLIEAGGKCLNSSGHIYYLADDSRLGLVALIDASECPPTYGADVNDVRGFVTDGYFALKNKQQDISHVIPISYDYFEQDVLPHLSENDLMVFIGREKFEWVNQKVLESRSVKVVLSFCTGSSPQISPESISSCVSLIHTVSIPHDLFHSTISSDAYAMFSEFYLEIVCKWTCNCLTTGAHILRGKIYQNYMVDVKVRNNKLFNRAAAIVERFGKCSKDEASRALLKSIYATDELSSSQLEAPISQHISAASDKDKVVPLSIIIARLRCSVCAGKKLLQQNPVVRQAILYSIEG